MKHLCTSLLVFFGFAVEAISQPTWSEAMRYYQAQDYRTALQIFERMDSSLRIQEKLGYCAYQLGNYVVAKDIYTDILRSDSLHQNAHVLLATIYDQEFNLPKSIKHYLALTTIDSTNPTYFKLTAKAYRNAHLPRLALQYFEQARQLSPTDINVLVELADLLMANKAWVKADSLVQNALAIDSANLRVLLAGAHCAYGLKKYSVVTSLLEKTKGKLDLTPFYQKMLGYAYLQSDSLHKAIHTLSNLLHEEESEYTYSYLGKAYLLSGSVEEAAFYYQKAVRAGISDHLDQYHSALAKINLELGAWKESIRSYEEAYRYGRNPVFILHKGQACEKYYRNKQLAVDQYERFLRLTTEQNQYQHFARERIRLLKEYLHQSGR